MEEMRSRGNSRRDLGMAKLQEERSRKNKSKTSNADNLISGTGF